MSMIFYLVTASDDRITQLLKEPKSIKAWLAPRDEAMSGSDDHVEVDLDKAWHAIHFLLCGSAEESEGLEAFLLSGGTPIGKVDVGYGPARALRSEEVQRISQMLAPITLDVMRARFNYEALEEADVYPTIWDRKDPEDVDYVLESYEMLRDHLATAASKRMGMVLYLA